MGTKVTHQGLSYPRALNESPRYHYRGGGARGESVAGEPTKGWFAPKALRQAMSAIRHYLKLLEREIWR